MKLTWIDGKPNAWDFIARQVGRIIDEETGDTLVYVNQSAGTKHTWAYLPGATIPYAYFLTVKEAQRTMINYKGLHTNEPARLA